MKRREKRAVRARSGTAAKDRGLDLRWEGTLRMGLQGPAPGSREQKLFLSIPLTVSSSFSKSSSSAPMMLTGTRPGRGAPGAYGRGGLASAHSAPHLTGPPPTPYSHPLALSTHRPSGQDVVCLHGLRRAGGRGGAKVRGWEEVALGGYSQIPGPGVKVSKQPSPIWASTAQWGLCVATKSPSEASQGGETKGRESWGRSWSPRSLALLGP